MAKALNIYSQLKELYEANCRPLTIRYDVDGAASSKESEGEDPRYEETVQCLLEGLFMNIAYFDTADKVKKYKTYSNNESVDIHPSSLLFQKWPRCVLYSAMVKTKGTVWLKAVTEIANDDWIDDVMPRIKQLTLCTVNAETNDDGDGGDDENTESKRSKGGKPRRPKNGVIAPGPAVKRMHRVFDDVNSGRFDHKKYQKNQRMKQNHHSMYAQPMPMAMKYANFNVLNQRNQAMFGYSGQNNRRYGQQHSKYGKKGNRRGRGRGKGRRGNRYGRFR